MNGEEMQQESAARILADAQRQAGMASVLYPEDDPRKERLIKFVARLKGDVPDAYDANAAGIAMEYIESAHEGREPDWEKAAKHPAVRNMLELTVSLGIGRGRKEGVELGKSNPPVQPRQRLLSFRKGTA